MTVTQLPAPVVQLGDDPLANLQFAVARGNYAFATLHPERGSEYIVLTDDGIRTLGTGGEQGDRVIDIDQPFSPNTHVVEMHNRLYEAAVLFALLGLPKDFAYGSQWPADAKKFVPPWIKK
jgi:hypothetical protein